MALRRRILTTSAAALMLALPALPTVAAGQIVPGQRDTFEDGTTQGWGAAIMPGVVHPAPPVNVPAGGPGGADDAFLRLTSIGGTGAGIEPGSRLSTLNVGNQWTGDYLAAGITHIELDAINLGSTDLLLRILISDPLMGPPANIAVSAVGIPLAPGGSWTHLAFPLFGPGGLIANLGSVSAALMNATELRVYHSETPALPPTPVAAQLGVDNITASVVPEPASLLLVATGMLALIAIGRRRPRS